LLTIISQT